MQDGNIRLLMIGIENGLTSIARRHAQHDLPLETLVVQEERPVEQAFNEGAARASSLPRLAVNHPRRF